MSRPLALILAALLIALGAWRIGQLVTQQPVLGYANQFDMGRTSACLGLWPRIAPPARFESSREAPIGAYVVDSREIRSDECYLSTEVALASVAVAAWRVASGLDLADRNAMDLRFVGGVKALLLVLVAIGLTIALRGHPGGAVAHAAVFAFVMADPVVTLYLNTLYTEFAAATALYVAIVALAMIVVEQPETRGWYVTFGAALVALGLSRQQHAFLPALLLLLVLPAMWSVFRRGAGILALIVVGIVALQLFAIPRPASITSANNVNVVFGALLPASPRQAQAVESLGLPASCESMIGATWYVTMGEDLSVRCPDAMTMRRSQMLGLLATQPTILVTAFARMAPLSQPALLRYVGVEERWRFATIEKQFGINGVSIGTAVERIPVEAWLGILVFVLAAFPLSLLAWARTIVRDGSPSLETTVASALTGTVAYALATSLLGDGMVEVPRHAHLAMVSLIALPIAIAGWAIHRAISLSPSRRGRPHALHAMTPSPWYEWLLIAGAITLVATGPLWLATWQAQPLAVGVVDEPDDNRVSAPIIYLHGWAMDPFGPVSAYSMVNGSKRIDAKPWQHPRDPRGVELARVFPTYRDPARARFEVAIDTAQLPKGQPIDVRTFARNRNGVTTEIDRRVFQRAK